MNRLLVTKQVLAYLYENYPLVEKIVKHIDSVGGHALLVGGAVRDALLGCQAKDYDIEVYGLSADQLKLVLSIYVQVDEVGKSFGVFKMQGIPVDWSLPRADSAGRKPTVVIDSQMDYRRAFARRDLTINAMGIDLVSEEFIDPFNGLQDVQNKMLRAPSLATFTEDPLRFFRVMQFIARFEMAVDPALQELCKTMIISAVAVERIEQEFKKLFLQAKYPSKGLMWLQAIGRLQEVLPELHATIGVVQDKKWHPEGDVFTHVMQAVDAAAVLGIQKGYDEDQRLLLCYAVLCHDLGKVTTTFEDTKGIHSYGHAEAGAPIAKNLLDRIWTDQKKIKAAVKLVYFHMMPGMLVRSQASISRYKVLAARLAPDVSMQQLADVAMADRRGRNAQSSEPLTIQDIDVLQFIENSGAAGVLDEPVKPVLSGKDLLSYVGDQKKIGPLLKKAYDLQLKKDITDKSVLLKWLLSADSFKQ